MGSQTRPLNGSAPFGAATTGVAVKVWLEVWLEVHFEGQCSFALHADFHFDIF